MAEGNGVKGDWYGAPDPSMQGWYFVDALDGRRWIGLYAETSTAPHGELLPDEWVLCPCFECPPDRAHTGVAVPAQKLGVGSDGKPAMQVALDVQPYVTFKSEIGHSFEMKGNGLVPRRVRRSSAVHIGDFAPEHKGVLRRLLAAMIEQCKPALPDSIKAVESREKVR